MVIKIGGKCAGPVENVKFETLAASPVRVGRGVTLAGAAAPNGGELQITLEGKLPTDLDSWNSKGEKAEPEDITIVEWSDDHKIGYEEDFKHVQLGKVSETEPKTDPKKITHGAASEQPRTTMHFIYASLTETQLGGKSASQDCPDTAMVIVKIDGVCAGKVDDVKFTSHDTPPKTTSHGESVGVADHKDPKKGTFDVTLTGFLPTTLDSWSKQGKSADARDITIIHWDVGHTKGLEEDFSKVRLMDSATQVKSGGMNSVPLTTMQFAYVDLTEKKLSDSAGAGGAWGH